MHGAFGLLFKLFIERLLVEEDIIVAEILVEPIVHLFHAGDNTGQVAIPGKDNYGGVCFPCRRREGGICVEV